MNHLVYYGQMMAMKKPMLDIIPKRGENKRKLNLVGALCTINDLVINKLPVSNLELGRYICIQKYWGLFNGLRELVCF